MIYFKHNLIKFKNRIKNLKIQLNFYNEELKRITRLETELKEMQIDTKNLREYLNKMNKENTRLQLNNKQLMELQKNQRPKHNRIIEFQQNILMHNKIGVIINSRMMFQGDCQEVFIILTNVGLDLFKKPGDAEPKLFVSFVEAVVIKNPLFDTSKQNTIKIRSENCDSEFVFNATSVILLDQWHDAIQTAIVEQVKQQNQYLLYQQKQVMDHRNQTIVDQLENHNYTNKLS